jgi:putative ABC transport system permease protein
MQDIRNGVRQLVRQRGSSIVAILTLALGIGLSTALFSVIHATMLRPLPYPHPEQLVSVSPEVGWPDGSVGAIAPSMADLRAWQAADDVFSAVAGSGSGFRLLDGPEPERLHVEYLTEQYLSMFGVAPLIGRDFTREDCEDRAPLTALLGYGFWQSRYGGRADALGETIRLDGAVATIVGVLPAWFNGTTAVSLPLRVPPAEYSRRGSGRVWIEGRLKAGVSLEEARDRLTARIAGTNPGGREPKAIVESQLESTTSRYRTTIYVFVGAVTLIVVLAAVNVAGLLLARGAARRRELDVRASLGASRRQLLQQLLIESLILAIPAGVLGIALAWLSLDAIVANIPFRLPSNSPVTLNVTVLAATAALLLITAVLSGLAPAIRLSRTNVGAVMLRPNRQMGSALSRRGGQILIAAEIALAVILVAGAALMLRSFARISAVDLGFNADGLVTMEVMPLVQSPPAHKEYYRTLIEQLRTVPGIARASAVDNFALGGSTSYTDISAKPVETFSTIFDVLPGYFETIEATLREGRLLTDADYASQFRGAVINESAARALFPGVSAVGREFTRAGQPRPWVVLGVIRDLRHKGPLNADEQDKSQIFFPFEPTKRTMNEPMTIVVRPASRAAGLTDQMQRVAHAIGPRVVIEHIRSADDLFTERVMTPRRRMILLTLLGALGLVLALVGVFGTTAYAVTRRTAEIGLRLAVGARPAQVVRTIIRDSAAPIVVGTAIGLAGAAAATRAIESFLFQTSPTDPVTLAAVAIVLIVAGTVAALVPALRAATIDPATTLRTE